MTDRTYSDLISVLLDSSRLSATVYANPRTGGDWLLVESALSPTFHLLVRGNGWMHRAGCPPIELAAGDLAVLMRADRYVLAAGPETRGDETRLPEPAPAGGRVTELISGRFDFGDMLVGEILDDLPDLMIVRSDSMRLDGVARLLAAEAAGGSPGRQVAMDRLSDLLFIALIRHLMERGDLSRGLLAALGDARISRALAVMHAEPAEPWTLQTLAATAGMSRTAFAKRFRTLMGTTPLRWLTRVRMDKAQALLAQSNRPVGSVALEVGYDSETAFRRAFKRWRGTRSKALAAT
jgi:AraC family transcriptional regulator, activator of mtrCDE